MRIRALLASSLAASLAIASTFAAAPLGAQTSALHAEIDRITASVTPKVVAWRRDIHEHPELSGQEVRTAALVAKHLRSLGMEVREGVGGTGVVGVLKGGRPGRVVALRADMDALPVTEQVDLPFKSKVRAQYNGQEVGVMHACGHDNHVAILMGAAEVLSGMKARMPGSVVFIFQPAEEGGHPKGGGGAQWMLVDGAFDDPKVDAVFGLHVGPGELGAIGYRAGPMMAASNNYRITVHGKQTHGAVPSAGIDPIVVGAQVVMGLQTIVSRQVDISAAPAIVTVGTFNAGVRGNIIPDSAVMTGTIRTFNVAMRNEIFERVKRTAEQIAASAGARAVVQVDSGYSVTRNDSTLTARMLPTLQRVVGVEKVNIAPLMTTAEDFSFYQERVPGLYFFLGVTPAGQDPAKAPTNHSPLFFADEGALPIGVRLISGLAVDYLGTGRAAVR
ncbi:MAG TPA: amidohydrolase [Gemmatimonadaceae bacterium]|nr:amidohydrolase [Gemmatimonadaceae bacterium]